MPCRAFSAACLRSSSIQRCSVVTTPSVSPADTPASLRTMSSQCFTAASTPCCATNSPMCRRAYGNSTSFTKLMELVVPSMSVRMTSIMDGSRRRLRLQAREALGDLVAGEIRHPAGRIGEQADRHELRLLAHVEPVAGVVRHADQVAGLAPPPAPPVAKVQGEQAA